MVCTETYSNIIHPHWFPHFLIEPSSVSCSPRGLISLNTSVSYLIEPLPDAGDAQQHAVYRAENLRLRGGSCLHHHGNKEHEEGLNDFIHGMMSPQGKRVSLDRKVNHHRSAITLLFLSTQWSCRLIFCMKLLLFFRKKGTWARIWSM